MAYNLRYNRAAYLDALASELCKHKIMNFVPSIPVKQQRLVRQMQQRQFGGGDESEIPDFESLRKAVESVISSGTARSNEDNQAGPSQLHHIGSAPVSVLPQVSTGTFMGQREFWQG
ncbi:unnamed protein product [Gongylonema pulchrum]|uniref:Uncharacterized protein n=1 Tax=Gongylonema pulchrum TaxID=637853 RepID=A0A183D1U4_9BILA|nr:unnamed protein product [Gongylonema pulchrum]